MGPDHFKGPHIVEIVCSIRRIGSVSLSREVSRSFCFRSAFRFVYFFCSAFTPQKSILAGTITKLLAFTSLLKYRGTEHIFLHRHVSVMRKSVYIIGSCQRRCAKCLDSDYLKRAQSTIWAFCSPFIHSVVYYDSVS